MAVSDQQIDTGDTVFHAPSGEQWLVGKCEGSHVYYLGWPPGGCGRIEDCTLLVKAPPDYRIGVLRDLANGKHPLSSWARAQLESECNE